MAKKSFILHIDMNSYFASCEQQANPFLRGKPVGVCAYLSPNGCIIASSIEAKEKGVVTGLRVKDGKKLCPDLILIQNEPDKYRAITERIFSILHDYTDVLEPYSIDEAFLDLTGWVGDFSEAWAIGKKIRSRIKKEAGEWLKCSIGISQTRFLAKFASDIGEKDSILVIPKEKAHCFFLRPLTDAWGINTRIEARLNWLGIRTLHDLKNYPVANLMQLLGIRGYYLWANLNGIEIEGVKRGQDLKPKSIGHTYCLPKKTTDMNYLTSVLLKLCEKTGRRLRLKNLEARLLAFGFSYTSGGGFFRHRQLKKSLFTTESIYKEALRIFKRQKLLDKVRFLAVSVSNFTPISCQQSLFEDNLRDKDISLAMDIINDKYGEHIVSWGRMWNTSKLAPDRIGFRKTIEL